MSVTSFPNRCWVRRSDPGFAGRHAAEKVSGHASITQSVSPPLQFQANVWGHYSQAKLHPSAEHHIVLSLDGSPSSPNSQIAETFHLQGILDQDWQDGNASYRFFYQDAWHTVAHAIVTEAPAVHPEPRSGSKPYPIPSRYTPPRCSSRAAATIWRR